MSYRLVYTDFWTDPKVMEEMTPKDRFFYLYLLTNPSTTNCGIYLITKKQMAFELGYSIEDVNSLMDSFENSYRLIAYNPETRELAIKNWGKYNLSRGGKPVVDCLMSELSKVKDKNLIRYIEGGITNKAMKELYQSFYDTSANGGAAAEPQENNTITDTNTNSNTCKVRDTNTEKNNNGDINRNSFDKREEDEEKDVHNLSLSLLREYEKVTGQMGVLNLAAIKLAVNKHGSDNVKKALDKALEKGKVSMPYVNGILETWAKEGYPTGGEQNVIIINGKYKGLTFNQFTGFKPHEARTLTEEERESLQRELL